MVTTIRSRQLSKSALVGLFAFSAIASLPVLPRANAQTSDQEFQMGRAREACNAQAQQQGLTVNRVVATTPVTGSGGRMIGSEVTMQVTRRGETYNVRCSYDNSSRSAIILGPANRIAVVNASTLNVRLVPAMNAPVLYRVPRGTELIVLDEEAVSTGVWYQVRAKSSQYPQRVGWVSGQYVTLR